MKKMSLGEEKFKVWIEKVKAHTETTPMEKLLNASEFVPQSL
jgi:hypothetical protein